MSGTPAKIWPHLIIWLALAAYMVVAPRIHDHLYVDQGLPVRDTGEWSMRVLDGYSIVDNLVLQNSEMGLFRLNGWAFAPVRPRLQLKDYERQVILFSPSQVYVLPGEAIERPDLQSSFAARDLGMDVTWAGFSAPISSGALKPGCYEIRLMLKEAAENFSYTVKTGSTLRRTPNNLVLDGPSAAGCSDQ